ncbi:hypothetical protein GobsT_25990 [Gemmata obscuriglobus]|uniref:Protein kinase domain-containing protein n=1 Tax=Gemmata obscuriglobus TaxID=114 RepID=A0A2Z3H2N9_9BACT|nr:hypothetical protein [Gemmata obscuriglobus]AWM39121.1 hypothetical protein C1280_20455 [Gemmata obscuriglobus]QEG27835.1 hypothetical protein GobsT_25990 [Gemmata obscuriglobus]VTS05196.1 dna topoisomerase type ia zn finger domain-containing protein : Helix-hairpin-helix DNA-binding domain containing protein kinase OS=Sphingomonas paucimobilis GN=BV96_01249 PE=4 SV=1 [Gemmata obscuriglobus UQM 2246]
MADLVVWSPINQCTVRLTPAGVSGGQTELFWFKDDPARCAGVPVGGSWAPSYWAKIEALIALADPSVEAAFPDELLLDPRDRKTPLGFGMKKASGIPHTQIVIPAERAAQGLNWGPREVRDVALQFARLFARFERLGITQNDSHGGNYLVDWPRFANRPTVFRVDALAFGFHWSGTYFGCDAAVFEFLPPELHSSDLSTVEFTRDVDRYSLACLLFPLLTGGSYPWNFGRGKGTAAERVARKEFAMFTNPRGTKVPPSVETAFNTLPAEVIVLFERAFLGDPAVRPAPREWLHALKLIDTRWRPTLPRLKTGRLKGLGRAIAQAMWPACAAVRAHRWMLLAVTFTVLAAAGPPKALFAPRSPGEPALPASQAGTQGTDSGQAAEEPTAPTRRPKNTGSWQNLR